MSCCNFSSTTTWRVVTAREIYCTILHSNCVGHLNTRYDPLKRTSNKQPGGVHLPRCSYPVLTVAKTVVTSSGVAGPLAAWCGGQICRPNFLNPLYTIQPVVKPAWQPVWQQVLSCKPGFRFWTSSSAIAETARSTSYFDSQNWDVEFLSHPFGA